MTGILKAFEGCLLGKAKHKAINKVTHLRSGISGERIFVDTTKPFTNLADEFKY